MNAIKDKFEMSQRAIASVVFACTSVYVFRICDDLILLPGRSHQSDPVVQLSQSQLSPFIEQLEFVYATLAVISVIWCVLSWRSERRIVAIIATLFSVVAMCVFVWRAIEDSISGL